MGRLNPFQWQGSGRVYSLPWLKNRLEYSSDPERIGAYAKTPFTRSKFVMSMLTQFHLSNNSIVVSEDEHAMWLKRVARPHMPTDEIIPDIARDLMDRVFPATAESPKNFALSDRMIQELYLTMLDKMLQVQVLPPLESFILKTKFPHGSRPMVLEGIMYSLRLHLPFMRPVKYFFDSLFFRRVLYMKRLSKKLDKMVYDFTIPKPDSWFATLAELRNTGKITRAQFRGEITAILVSSFSLAAALGSAILCLAARPQYQRKIKADPSFARYFVMEVLRLYPPFRQFGYEQTTKEGSFATEFMIPVFHLHRNSDIWTDPKKFNPERFLDPDAAKGFKYLPFGMGKRSCPGRNFSLSMITQAVKYLCSDDSPVSLERRETLPRGGSGRLVSFAVDDHISYRIKGRE